MSLSERASRWRAEARRAVLLDASATAAAGSAAAFAALALLDRAAALPKAGRLAAFALWSAWLASLVVRRGWRPWRARGWDAVFAAAARRWPDTGPLFASAWALRAGPAAPGTSDELRAEHLARAGRRAADLPPEPLFAWSPPPATLRLAAAAAALLAANAVWGDAASWARVAAPWRDADLGRWVAVEPGDARVEAGAPAVLRAAVRPGAEAAGVRAAALTLETRGADGAWRALEWTRAGDAGAERRLDAVAAPLDYRVRWRDLAGRAYRLEPVPPPRWSRATAVVRDPRGERRYVLGEDGAVRARRGDWVGLEASADAPLASAAVRVPDGGAPLALRQDGRVWRGGFAARAEGSFSFELVSADGRRDPSPPAYALAVAADAPPTAELISPQVPLALAPDESLTVTYALRDDSGLTRAALVVAAAGRPERAVPLPLPSPARAEVVSDFSWSPAGLAPGTKVRFWVEAWDDASPPQRGVSEKGEVEVVDAAADHAAALDARARADAAVEAAAARAEAARDAARAGDLAAAAREERALRPEWTAARAALDAWAQKAQGDPRGDPGLAEEARRAAEEFARAGEDGLPAAERALARADAPAASREADALAAQARGVQQALREGARAQSVQDHARSMGEAGKASEDMAAQAEALAARGSEGTVSAAELEKLEQALAEVEKRLEELRQAVKSLPEVSEEQAGGRTDSLPLEAARESAGELRRALQNGDVKAAAAAARKLAERLKALAKTLDDAGRRAAESRGSRSGEAASRVRRAWQDAVDAQTKAVESVRQVEESRLQGLLARQRELLRDEAAAFDARASSWVAAGLPRSALPAVAEAGRRLKAGDAAGAADLLRAAAGLTALDGRSAPGRAADEDALAAALEAEAARLGQGPPAPPADPARARASAAAQEAALDRARSLRSTVEGAARQGYLSGRVTRRVDDALSEEEAGAGALRRGDSGEGLKRAEAALAILQDGGKDADGADSAASGASSAMGTGGASGAMTARAAPRGSTGARYERVRLPSADEYRPPRELREELERSLQEPRPAAHDPAIKEYFKRLAR